MSHDECKGVLRELAQARCSVKEDVNEAWREWAGSRATYDAALLQLAELTTAPYAPWDRSSPKTQQPRMRRWEERLAARLTPTN